MQQSVPSIEAGPWNPTQAPLSLAQAVDDACGLIPPLWTLRNFVAVNTYLGLVHLPFRNAAGEVDRLFHARSAWPEEVYREQYRRGRIDDHGIRTALAELGEEDAQHGWEQLDSSGLEKAMLRESSPAESAARVRTLSEIVDLETGSHWTRLVTDEISKWCAGRFDRGQAAWSQPWRDLPAYEAWRELASIDRSSELRGLTGFRAYVRSLPEDAMGAIEKILEQLAVPPPQWRDLLAREIASIAGWAGHAQYLTREAESDGRTESVLRDLLAIRLAFDGGLHRALDQRDSAPPICAAPPEASGPSRLDIDIGLAWQTAYEASYRTRLLEGIRTAAAAAVPATSRPRLQAVFCIDVRSEVLRRHLESMSPGIQTLGFAGFFGMPIAYVPVGAGEGEARCPVLIDPPHRLLEKASPGSDAAERRLSARSHHLGFARLRKLSVSAFPLVETVGHFFGLRLVTDSLGWAHPRPGGALFGDRVGGELSPVIDFEHGTGVDFGIPLAERIDLAAGALRGMGLTDGFAEIVLLCGHGGRTVNNPYASSLDCGACGGHPGDVNARVAAALLNSPEVRAGLAGKGIDIPEDTRFLAGLHDTTRDVVTLYEDEGLKGGERVQLQHWLDEACKRTAQERATRLGARKGRALGRRSRDWSEVRPEWGLAGNAAFIAAPRRLTRGLDLQGRAFLHDYDPSRDPEGDVLRVILTAPLVVASWINLQYYASSVDNEKLGSGSKVLHNVVGRHGVMTGNRSDLRVGLPWQSVHDGTDFVHEPMRLVAVVAASPERMDGILAEHADTRNLVDNRWIRLVAWDADENVFRRRVAAGDWREEQAPTTD